jgi:predicted nucleic acid-binding protein
LIVLDASVAISVMLNVAEGHAIRERLETSAGPLLAPEVFDLEVLQVMRRYVRQGGDAARATQAFQTLADLNIERYSHGPLMARIWQLRDNLTAFDAAYFALAELLDVPLWTKDSKFEGVPGTAVKIELV